MDIEKGFRISPEPNCAVESGHPTRILASGKTDIGLRRANNEDAYLVNPDLRCFAVADGVGGSAAGEIASRIFVETALEVFEMKSGPSGVTPAVLVQESFRLGNERILTHSDKNPDCMGMGCTAELITFSDNSYILGHIGDSRSYLFRDGELRQITRDHSLVQSQLDRGLITPENARKHSLRNVVLRVVGIDPTVELDMIRGKTLPGDLFLLCSDGLTDLVEDEVILAILASQRQLNEKVDMLIESAKSAGGNDNITVVLCLVLA